MSLTLFFRRLIRRPDRRPVSAGPRRSFIPRFTALEDRRVPSTFTVMNLADSGPGSLRAGVASGADTIKFAPGLHGTIPLASEIAITADLKIHGPGEQQLTVSGGNTTRVFHVSGSGTHLAIDDLTIANGLASLAAGPAFGGGLLNDGASVTLSDVVFADNAAVSTGGYAGGGAVANLGGHFTADDADFLGNSASAASNNFGAGGAVYDDEHAVVVIDHGTFAGNLDSAGNANGGAIGHYGASQLTLEHCSFDGNQALGLFPGSSLAFAAGGGGIESDETAGFFGNLGQPTMTVTHSSFTGNVSHVATPPAGQVGGVASGGGLDIEDGAEATLSDCTFANNRVFGGDGGAGAAGQDGGAGGYGTGGAILNTGTVTVSDSLFLGNQARGGNGGKGGDGGGNGGDAGYSPGGAIQSTLGSQVFYVALTTVSDCLFVGNQAIGGSGGAGGSGGNGGNAMRGDGGAIAGFYGTQNVSDCTIVFNTAQGGAGGAAGSGAGTVGGVGGLGRGGGFSNERGMTGTVTDTLIAFNQALGGAGAAGGNGGNAIGGGVYNGRVAGAGANPTQPATLELLDCAVAANLARGGAGGVGGNGGTAQGGGVFNGNTTGTGALITTDPFPSLDLDGTDVIANRAVGGAAGAGGVAGTGVGGGLYNQVGAVAEVDALSHIKGNRATTSDDDIFGSITPV